MSGEIISQEEKEWLLSIPDVLENYENLKNLDKDTLALMLAKLIAALNRIDDETRFVINCMFRPFRVIQRNYEGRMGLLWGASFEVSALKILEEAQYERYSEGIIVREKKVSKFTKSYIMGYELILEKEEHKKEEEKYG